MANGHKIQKISSEQFVADRHFQNKDKFPPTHQAPLLRSLKHAKNFFILLACTL